MVGPAFSLPSGTAVVGVLTRAPSAGGKRRLFAELGRPIDPTLLEALLLDTVDRVRAAGIPLVLFVEPSSATTEIAALLADCPVLPQRDGDLGARMAHAMETLFAAGAGQVALVGSDLPWIDPACVTGAFAALTRIPAQLVLGPAEDGGYYLIAATSVPPVFAGIDWGTARVLSQTRAAAAAAGVDVHLLARAGDVDAVTDLRAAPPDAAPRTRAWVVSNLEP